MALEKGSWELVFNGDGVSGWENEKVLEMDGGDDHTAVWMCSMPQNSLSVMVKKASITLWIFHCNTNLEKLLYMIFSVDKFKDWIRSIPVFWVPSWGLGWEFKYRSDKLRGFNLGVGFYLHHFLDIMGSRGYFFTKNPHWWGTEEALTDVQKHQILVWAKHGTKVHPERKRVLVILGPAGKRQGKEFTKHCWREN